jgi:Tfp pilus assembly protein PilF
VTVGLTAATEPAPPAGQRPGLLADWRLHFWAITAAALVPRLIYLAQIHRWPFFYYPILDSRTQNGWATIIVQTLGIGNNEVLAKPPLYTYFLALMKALVGTGDPSLLATRLMQMVLAAVTCGVTYLIGRRVFGPAVGLLAGLLLALYGPGIFDDGELLDTALATFLATLFLFAWLAALDRPTAARWFGVGLLLGLLGLTRGNLLLLAVPAVVVLIAWLRKALGREDLRRTALLFLLGVVLPIVPITARNYLLMDNLIPISNNGGINFYTGNNPQADGFSPIPSGVAWERTWYEQTRAGAYTLRQQENYWTRKGLRFWLTQPAQALALLLKKVYLYWGAYEIPNNLSYDWGIAHASLLRAIPLSFAIIGPLGLLGIALGGWRSRERLTIILFIAVQMLAVILFFVCGRYRMPALPAICILSVAGLAELARLARWRSWRGLALALVALAGLAALLNADLYGVGRTRGANRDWVYLGQSYMMQARPSEARTAFQRALALDPSDADAWSYLAGVMEGEGDHRGAADAFRQALRNAPDYATAAARFAALVISQGWPVQEAERLLVRALTDQPSNTAALVALVRVSVRLGNTETAATTLQALAEAFRHWDVRDTRYASTEVAIQQAVAEAAAAGVAIPPALASPQQGSEAPPLQTESW